MFFCSKQHFHFWVWGGGYAPTPPGNYVYDSAVMTSPLRSTFSLPSSARSSFMEEDYGNSCFHTVGASPDDDREQGPDRKAVG